MKLGLLLFLFSLNLLAQDPCDPKANSGCASYLTGKIMGEDLAAVKAVLKKHGIAPFMHIDGFGRYRVIHSASFFKFDPLFKLLVEHPDYPGTFEKGMLYRALFDGTDIIPRSPEIVRLHFFHDNPARRFTWYENPKWPLPFYNQLKAQLSEKDKTKYAGMFEYFAGIDAAKKNTCSIKSAAELDAVIKNFPGIEIYFGSAGDLLGCALKSKNYVLADALIDRKMFGKGLVPNTSILESNPVTRESFATLQKLTAKAREVQHLDLGWGEADMSLIAQDIGNCKEELQFLFPDVAKLFELQKHVAYRIILNHLGDARVALLEKNNDKYFASLNAAINLHRMQKIGLNEKDLEGKTFLHHLAEFADKAGIELVENSMNETYKHLNSELQDNEGNTPLHIALMNNNLSGAQALSDDTTMLKTGFSIGTSPAIVMKNKQGKTPLDLIESVTIPEGQRSLKKDIRRQMKEHEKWARQLLGTK